MIHECYFRQNPPMILWENGPGDFYTSIKQRSLAVVTNGLAESVIHESHRPWRSVGRPWVGEKYNIYLCSIYIYI